MDCKFTCRLHISFLSVNLCISFLYPSLYRKICLFFKIYLPLTAHLLTSTGLWYPCLFPRIRVQSNWHALVHTGLWIYDKKQENVHRQNKWRIETEIWLTVIMRDITRAELYALEYLIISFFHEWWKKIKAFLQLFCTDLKYLLSFNHCLLIERFNISGSNIGR